jgi:hypothetical protein
MNTLIKNGDNVDIAPNGQCGRRLVDNGGPSKIAIADINSLAVKMLPEAGVHVNGPEGSE